jgi:hypothetical protein
MISRDTGSVKVDKGRTLVCGQFLADFEKKVPEAELVMKSDPWTVFKLPLTDSRDAPFVALVKFYEDRLREIELFAKDAPDIDVDELAKMYDRWLVQELGDPPYKFDWGRLDASLDRKAGNASVVLIYGDILY